MYQWRKAKWLVLMISANIYNLQESVTYNLKLV